jgi:hypothetical protein
MCSTLVCTCLARRCHTSQRGKETCPRPNALAYFRPRQSFIGSAPGTTVERIRSRLPDSSRHRRLNGGSRTGRRSSCQAKPTSETGKRKKLSANILRPDVAARFPVWSGAPTRRLSLVVGQVKLKGRSLSTLGVAVFVNAMHSY